MFNGATQQFEIIGVTNPYYYQLADYTGGQTLIEIYKGINTLTFNNNGGHIMLKTSTSGSAFIPAGGFTKEDAAGDGILGLTTTMLDTPSAISDFFVGDGVQQLLKIPVDFVTPGKGSSATFRTQ